MQKEMREFSPKFLVTASAFCQQLTPYLAGIFKLARACRNLNSWGCRVGCAIPDGMVTDVHMSVWDAQQCSRPQKCKCVSRLAMPAVVLLRCPQPLLQPTVIQTQLLRVETVQKASQWQQMTEKASQLQCITRQQSKLTLHVPDLSIPGAQSQPRTCK